MQRWISLGLAVTLLLDGSFSLAAGPGPRPASQDTASFQRQALAQQPLPSLHTSLLEPASSARVKRDIHGSLLSVATQAAMISLVWGSLVQAAEKAADLVSEPVRSVMRTKRDAREPISLAGTFSGLRVPPQPGDDPHRFDWKSFIEAIVTREWINAGPVGHDRLLKMSPHITVLAEMEELWDSNRALKFPPDAVTKRFIERHLEYLRENYYGTDIRHLPSVQVSWGLQVFERCQIPLKGLRTVEDAIRLIPLQHQGSLVIHGQLKPVAYFNFRQKTITPRHPHEQWSVANVAAALDTPLSGTMEIMIVPHPQANSWRPDPEPKASDDYTVPFGSFGNLQRSILPRLKPLSSPPPRTTNPTRSDEVDHVGPSVSFWGDIITSEYFDGDENVKGAAWDRFFGLVVTHHRQVVGHHILPMLREHPDYQKFPIEISPAAQSTSEVAVSYSEERKTLVVRALAEAIPHQFKIPSYQLSKLLIERERRAEQRGPHRASFSDPLQQQLADHLLDTLGTMANAQRETVRALLRSLGPGVSFQVEVGLDHPETIRLSDGSARIYFPANRLPQPGNALSLQRFKADLLSELYHVTGGYAPDDRVEPTALLVFVMSEGVQAAIDIHVPFVEVSEFARRVVETLRLFQRENPSVNDFVDYQTTSLYFLRDSPHQERSYIDMIFAGLWQHIKNRRLMDPDGVIRTRALNPVRSGFGAGMAASPIPMRHTKTGDDLARTLRELFQSALGTKGQPSRTSLLALYGESSNPLARQRVIEIIGRRFFEKPAAAEEFGKRVADLVIRNELPLDRKGMKELLIGIDNTRYVQTTLENAFFMSQYFFEHVDTVISEQGFIDEVFSTYFQYSHPYVFVYSLYLMACLEDSRYFDASFEHIDQAIENLERWFDFSATPEEIASKNAEFPGFAQHHAYLKPLVAWLRSLPRDRQSYRFNEANIHHLALSYRPEAIPDVAHLNLAGTVASRTPHPLRPRMYDSLSDVEQRAEEAQFNDEIQHLRNLIQGRNTPAYLFRLPPGVQHILFKAQEESQDYRLDSLPLQRILALTARMLYDARRGLRFSPETLSSFDQAIQLYSERRDSFTESQGAAIALPEVVSFLLGPVFDTAFLPDALALIEAFDNLPEPHRSVIQALHLTAQGIHGPPVRNQEEYDHRVAETLLQRLLPRLQAAPTGPQSDMFRLAINTALLTHYDPANQVLNDLIVKNNPEDLAAGLERMALRDWEHREGMPVGALRHVLSSAFLYVEFSKPVHHFLFSDPWLPESQNELSYFHAWGFGRRADIFQALNEDSINADNPYLLWLFYQRRIRQIRALQPRPDSLSTPPSPITASA